MRMSRRRFLAGAASVLPAVSLGAPTVFAQVGSAGVISPVEVNVRPIAAFDPRDATHVRYGSLEFRSGLVLTSSFKGFGGLSALHLDKNGEQFISLSDKGDWFTGRIIYKGKSLSGLSDVKSTPMLGGDGKTLASRGWFDTESLAFDGAVAYVGIERVNQIVRFDFSKGGILSRGEPIAVPPALGKLPFNKGIESLVFVPRDKQLGGTLIAISERGLDAAGNTLAFLIGGPSPGQFTVVRTSDYDISDTMLLKDDLLILERKFSYSKGVGIRIRRMPLASVKPDAAIDGPAIFECDLGYEIDNMEGIDAHVTPEGETVLTLISDDNFSMIQRTLLLQFTLIDP
ncbi:MAG: esterase-like activity of phytase family protein [Pseudomonadota bacterium]